MVKAFTSEIFSSTYRDDFADSDNYHRILFNSGRALQARELTQLQTIMQKELGRLGKHIFKEGASVNPGGVTVNNEYEFIKLDTTTLPLPAIITDLVGIEFTSDSLVKFKVIEVLAATASDPATLYVTYTDTKSAATNTNSSSIRVSAGEAISSSNYSLTVQATNTISNPAVGQGTKASIHAGDFFAQEHFVFAKGQSLIISKYTSNPNTRLGFKVTQDILTSSDNSALFDNQGATPNLASPGADRYRINLTIADKADVDSDENFIEVVNIVGGFIQSQVGANDNYNQIANVMARRTKEESGDYIVKPFELEFETNDSDTSKVNYVVSSGIGYVDGFRVATSGQTAIVVSKPRSTITANNEVVAANYGSYVVVSGGKGIPNINELQLMNLRSAVTHGGSTIGTARVRHVEEDGANYRLYLFDIAMGSGQNFADVKSIGTGTTDFFNLILEINKAVLKDAANSSLLFELPNTRPQSVSDISLAVQRRVTIPDTGTGNNLSVTVPASGETFTDTNLWVMGAADSDIDTNVTITGAGTNTVSISGVAPNQTGYEVLAYVNKSAGVVRTKTLTERSQTFTTATDADSDGSGNVTGYTFDKPDIFSFDMIAETDSAGEDKTSIFETDNGQRDNFYTNGKLNLVAGSTAPTTLYVKYKHFEHGSGGDFFAVNSYTGQVNYENIPNFTRSNGDVINLRNVIDFRPVVNSSGTFGAGARINELPRPTDLITMDVNYYMGQAAKVVIGNNGQLQVIKGDAAIIPELPKSPENTLDLFNVVMNPFMIDDNDINSEQLTYKRFTMADIGKLEQRVSSLEETTALSLLELETSNFDIFDANGLSRTKSGFFVDNFADQQRTFTASPESKSAIDPVLQSMRPQFSNRNTNLFYDSDATDNFNVRIRGDNIMLDYNDVDYISNDFMTGIENVNPFSVVLKRGHMDLSPASDEWFDTEFTEPIVVDGGFVQGSVVGKVWNDWSFNWSGVKKDLKVGDSLGDKTGTNFTSGTQIKRTDKEIKISGIKTSTTFIDEEGVEVSRAFIPYMRTRKIFFKAQGLKPNTRHYPFFGLKSVDSWVKKETFQRICTLNQDWGTGYNKISAHPDGNTAVLETNADGELEGSFFLPNTKDIKFTSGDKAFTLIDISKNNEEDCTSIASSKFYAQGVLVHRQQTVLSTRSVDLEVTTSTTVVGVIQGTNYPGGSNNNDDDNTPTGPGVTYTSAGGWVQNPGIPGVHPGFTTKSRTVKTKASKSCSKDPLAQSFTVGESTGVFITKIEVRFQSKPAIGKTPVVAQLRPMVNGVPSADEAVPGSTVFKSPDAITVSEDGSAITTFTLEEPVYLSGNEDYCIVLLSDSNEYNAFVAEAGKFILGSTEKKLTKQATLGSLFKSQNGKTWEPDQTKDLTFKLVRANFAAGGTVILQNSSPSSVNVGNVLKTTNSSSTIEVFLMDHGFIVGSKVEITGATSVGGIPDSQLNAVHIVTHVTGDNFKFAVASNATSSTIGGGDFVIDRQHMFELARVGVENILPPATAINASARLTSGKSTAGAETAEQVETSYTPIAINKNVYFNSPKLLATSRNETDRMSGVSSALIKLELAAGNSYVSPVIDLQRTSLTTVHNRIDENNSFNVVSETNSIGGTSLAKHVTKPVTLSEKARGLKILLSANKPSASNFDVYFRTNSGGELLTSSYTLIEPETGIPASDNPLVFRDYRYLPGGINGTLNDFDQFQIKIVMRSTNNAKVPTFGDLRVIALTV
jgi:hypothetical protein